MASVQAPPGFAGPGQLPANLTKEMVQQAYQNYTQMKKQGIPENDPEFMKTRNLLAAVQRKTMYDKQQQAQQQAMMQQRQQSQSDQPRAQQVQQQNGASSLHMSNGTKPAPPSDGAVSAPATASSAPASGIQVATAGAQGQGPGDNQTPTSAGPVGGTAFAPEQLMLLRRQIAAFKHLSKGLPLPASMQQQLFASQQAKKPATPTETVAAASEALDAATRNANAPDAETSPIAPEMLQPNSFDNPEGPSYTLPFINYVMHVRRQKRTIIPAWMPHGYNMEALIADREKLLYNRLDTRKRELEKLQANIGSWDTRKTDTPEDDGKVKLALVIEQKMLNLLPKQRALRKRISQEMIFADNLAMTANRAIYRRLKKQSLREARITEKLEKQQRDARESKEKQKHHDFIESIRKHRSELSESGLAQRQRLQKLGRTMMTTHQAIEKEEQKRVERTAKQRLQALRANDEETYLKLLGQAKDTRISHLLKQTDGFLKQLSASVKQQQRRQADRYNMPQEPEEESEPEEDEEDSGAEGLHKREKTDYYEIAHRIKEEVTIQSSNLVGGTLKEYQLKGLQWMISLYNNNLNGILADEMGLGKTIQTISLITYLIEKKHQPGPYLVIVPLSTLTNWNNEFEKWAPSVQRIVYKGPPNQRKQHQQQIRWGQFQVLLTTYEFIIKDRPILSKIKWIHMIVDEGHRMKNANSKLSSTITQYYTTRYRLILTGTPLQNNLTELWAMLNFVLPTIFKSVKSFDEWFNTPFANTGGQDKMELTEEEQLLIIRRLHKVLRPFLLRRLKKDVEKDLPDKTERVIKCNFSALQAKLYKQLVTHNNFQVSDGKGGKTGMRGLSNMLMQLRKLCNHPFVFEQVEDQMNPSRVTNDLLWRTSGKFELLDRILPKFQASGHRVLIFFQMTQIMNIMEDFLRLKGMAYLRLDGSTKADDRSELLRLFNAPDSPYFCFLLSTRAGGLGLNLQTADTVIIYDSDWNPHQDLQAQDRAHRIGQKNEVRILRLITSNSVEEKILERANFKLDMDGKVIQAGKFDNRSTNEEREAMLRIMLESAEAAENLEQDEMDDEDLNMMMMRSDDELIMFNQMDKDRLANCEYGPGRKYPRLLGESELPDIYLNDDNPVVEEIEETNFGRGARERTRVKYDDGLTEEQWLEAVDNDEDSIEAAIARKEAKIAKRGGKPGKRLQEIGDSPAPSRESSEEPAPKKRGRKPKGEKRKADEASLDGESAAPAKKRGRPGPSKDQLSPDERALLQKILNAAYEALNDLEEESTDDDVPNRGIIDPFIDLPDKWDYPDYYQIIKHPICMNNIKRKINRKEYQSLKQFRQDIGLLCNNCRTYNEDTSLLYADANNIEKTCLDKLREETEDHPELQDFDDAASMNGGLSTAITSTVGTPRAATDGR
ncbi:SNF2 family N-terminal domain-domain-containing protein [Clohesyomyces aquaticus]|uniref:SNF2 family N-terminal domain-domain-containing protein n=1 Tax=Clohesyomyces aquaticus TaxID=1231657 RepID=A0A1Y2A4X4_9PLEO|nr:SNF2 family N-terminal domain-domain-containing protein [Clohesyomyces aquaticus]